MKTERITTGMVVRNKVNGGKYVIMDDMLAYPVVPETVSGTGVPVPDTGAEGIRITKSNAMAFKIVHDPTYDIVPSKADFSVRDGVIMSGGNPVTEQGELEIEEIVSVIPGGLLCTSRRKDRFGVLSFNLVNDKFKKIVAGEYQVVREVQPGMLYLENRREIVNEDGTKTPILEDATVIFNAGQKNQSAVDLDFIPQTISIIGDMDRILFSTAMITEEDESGQYVLADCKNRWISMDFDGSGVYTIESEDVVTATYSSIYGAVVLKSDKMVDVENRVRIKDPSIVEYLKGYDFLVDITPANDKRFYTFANWQYECRMVSVESTNDRGNVVKIAEIQ